MSGRYNAYYSTKVDNSLRSLKHFGPNAAMKMRYPFAARCRLRRKHVTNLILCLVMLLCINAVFDWFGGPGSEILKESVANDVRATSAKASEAVSEEEEEGLLLRVEEEEKLREEKENIGHKEEDKSNDKEEKDDALPVQDYTPLLLDVDPDGCVLLQCKDPLLPISVSSRLDAAVICVNGTAVVADHTSRPGLNIVQIDPATGAVADIAHFNTGRDGDDLMIEYINAIPTGRIVAVAIAKEAAVSLTPVGRAAFTQLGSWKVDTVQVGWKWALVGFKGSVIPSPYEVMSPPPQLPEVPLPAMVGTCLRLDEYRFREVAAYQLCANAHGRTKFCKELGVPMSSPSTTSSLQAALEIERDILTAPSVPVVNFPQPAPWDPLLTTDLATHQPIAIIGGNRANYLILCLRSLLKQPGIKPQLVTIYTDGIYEEMAQVARVFGVRLIGHGKTTSSYIQNHYFKKADEITQHYRFSLSKIFYLHPAAEHAIVLEEDLKVAPDFLYYFSQSLPILDQDRTLLTISAWNDNSYTYTSADPTKLYRTDFFPGLGWVLQKRIWEEVSDKWPECCQGFSWDLWIRHKLISKGRQVIIPDISRTFHFGRKGANVNNDFFYLLYFYNHTITKDPYVRLANIHSVLPEPYNEELHGLFKRAKQVPPKNDSKCPFEIPVSPPTADLYENVYVLWYKELKGMRRTANLEAIVACLKMWDLGRPRATYRGLVRAFINGNHVIMASDRGEFADLYLPDDAHVVSTQSKERRVPTSEQIAMVKVMADMVDDV